MKRMVLVLFALLIVASDCFAQAPDSAYVGLFADLARTKWAVYYTAAPPNPTSFSAYVFWLPSVRGIAGAEFAISMPDTNIVELMMPVKNAAVILQMGDDLETGVSISWGPDPSQCLTTWAWSHRLICYLWNTDQAEIKVVEHPGLVPPVYQVATCELGFPKEPVKRYTHLYLNYDGGISTEDRSWGAIKSLF